MNRIWMLFPVLASIVLACPKTEAGELYQFSRESGDRNELPRECRGKPRSPVCAALTFHMCVAHDRAELCALVGFRLSLYPPDGGPSRHPHSVEVMFVRPVPRKLAAGMPALWKYAPQRRSGDAEVGLIVKWCEAPCPDKSYTEVSVFVAEDARFWKVVGWLSDVGDLPQETEYPWPWEGHFRINIEEEAYKEYLRAYPLAVDLENSKLLSSAQKRYAIDESISLWSPQR